MGPASDENGNLQVADYANCGFGSSSAPAAGPSGGEDGALPATAVEVESAVLEHFPEEQREDAPFPTKVSGRPGKLLFQLAGYVYSFFVDYFSGELCSRRCLIKTTMYLYYDYSSGGRS